MAICDRKVYILFLISATVFVYIVISVVRNKDAGSQKPAVPSAGGEHRRGLPTMANSQHSPAAGYTAKMTIAKYGRLGNNLYQYAAVRGLSTLTGRQPVLSLSFLNPLEAFHVDVNFVPESALSQSSWRVYDLRARRSGINETMTSIASIGKSENIFLSGFFHSHLYFDNVKQSLRRELAFKEGIQNSANEFLSRAILKENATKVGIHLRLGDSRYWRERGFVLPPTGYFRKAMEYFSSKFDAVHFVVSSDHTNVASRKVLPAGFEYTFVRKESVYLDLAILTSCDHIIISRGTFSWWAGWLNKGTTVYYAYDRANSTDPVNSSSYIPRDEYNHWIAMSD